MKALVVIDYSNDFVADDGKLTAGAVAQDLDSKISQYIKNYFNSKDYIVFANDCHEEEDPYHPESQLFPPHNIVGTEGRQFYGQVGQLFNQIKDSKQVFYTDKRRYSAFSGTELDMRLKERQITDICLLGVVTDICILHTAIDAYNLGYQLSIAEDGVGSFNSDGHEWALDHFKNTLGAKLITL